jgi:AcrR family transcriptional regulator
VEWSVNLIFMDKKNIIYRAALELFGSAGFYGTPTAEIANKAKVANGTLFHYFPTKDLLIIALYMEVKDNFLLSITENYNREENYKDRIKALWKGIIRWATTEPNEFNFIQQFSSSPYMNQLTHEQKERHNLFFRPIFEEGQKKNILKDLPVDLLVQISLKHIYGLVDYIFLEPEFSHNQVKMDLAFDCYWDGICKMD